MLMQGPAADLAADFDYPVAIHLQGTPGGFVHVAEQSVHDAAAEEGDGWGVGAADPSLGCSGQVLRPRRHVEAPFRGGGQHTHSETEPSCTRQHVRYARRTQGSRRAE
jgi:hypothetical protein